MSVASKNLYDLLGNTIEDEDATPKQPPKIVEKATTHTVKRNADGQAPAARRAANDGSFRDRDVRSTRAKGAGEAEQNASHPRGGAQARVRGGRGSRNPRTQDDRHSRSTPHGGTDKTAAQSWGGVEGEAELKDEQAGEAIAKAEAAAAEGDAATPAAEAEEEDKSVSYSDYLAQLAEKKLKLQEEAALNVRQANEGSKVDKKWAQAKELVKEAGEEYFAGTGGKAKRERERKQKQVVELENRFIEAPEQQRTGGARGGRGGPRGGRGGESSGRGRGGEGRGRGGPRGGARGGDFPRGPRRGGDSGAAPVNPNDQSAFPSLGGKN